MRFVDRAVALKYTGVELELVNIPLVKVVGATTEVFPVYCIGEGTSGLI